jgi:Mrp family chromosome partitioning ATPase
VETGWYESVSLSDYLGVVARRKWIVLLVTVIFTVAAVAYSKHQQPSYTATAVLSSPPSAASVASKGAFTWSQQNAPQADSAAIASLVLGLSQPAALPSGLPTTVTVAPISVTSYKVPGLTAAGLLSSSTVVASTTADAIDFTVSNPSPGVAQGLANTWAHVYYDNVNLQNEITTADKYLVTYQTLNKSGATLPAAAKATLTQGLFTASQKLLSPPPAAPVVPAVSANQTQPQTPRNTVIGFVLGLLLGLILAFIQDLLDKRIGSAVEVGRRLRVPLLAAIPSPPRALRDHPLVLLAPRGGAQAPSAEAYRIAKLNLVNLIRTRHVRTIMFTSAGDREGTSTTTANLAIAFARGGQHVILVDANMRRPAAGRLFGLDDRAGLSDILAGHAAVGDALTALDVSAVHPADPGRNGAGVGGGLLEVLPAGAAPVDPAELLDTRTMTDLVAELRSRADVVLIDAPPILHVTDAMLIGTKVDGVVAVARSRLASRPHMVALSRALQSCAAPTLGFLFTGAPIGEDHDYGGLATHAAPEPAERPRVREPLP